MERVMTYDADKEMQRALEADGEKLRQLTGEDHGPWVLVPCPACDGAGEWDEGPLPASSGATQPEYRQVICTECEGAGSVYVPAEGESLKLAQLIETRLVGVRPEDQDLVLEDHDWRLIIAALRGH